MLALATGVMLPLTIPPFRLGALMWIALLPLLHATSRCGRIGAVLCGLLAGVVLAVTVNYGLLAFDRGLFAMMVVAVVAIVGAVALGFREVLARPLPPALRALAIAALWVGGEWLSIRLQAPWSAALTQTSNLPLIQGAAVLGMLWVSFLVILVNAALFEVGGWLRARRLPAGWVWMAAVVLLPLALELLYGAWCLAPKDAGGTPLRIATIQPVIPTVLYRYHGMNPDYRRTLRTVVGDLSAEASAGRPDLLVWSEGGNGLFNFRLPDERRRIEELARSSGATLLVSSYDLDEEGRVFNSVFAVAPDGALLGRYDKVRLTPIGERQFTPGRAFTPLPTPHGPVGAMVCFESCFPGPARALTAAGAQLLVVTTSDAAFQHSSLPVLHGLFAVYRAVENRRALVQAANTGPSFVVTAEGAITSEVPLESRAVLRGEATPGAGIAPYTRWGDWPLLAVLGGILAVAATTAYRTPDEGRRASPHPLPWIGGALAAIGCGIVLAAVSGLLATATSSMRQTSWTDRLGSMVSQPSAEVPLTAAHAFLQSRPNTCGIAALAYLLAYLGHETREGDLLPRAEVGPDGVSMASLAALARSAGLDAWGEWQNFDALRQIPKPVIAHVRDDHYVVVLTVRDGAVDLFDPSRGYLRMPESDFARLWRGYVLVVRFRPSREILSAPVRIPLTENGAAT